MADDYGIESVALAFSAGVDGYLVKAISCEPLGGALRLIALGEKVMPSQIIDTLTDPIWRSAPGDWESRSEEHTSELQSLMRISYAVFCLKKKKKRNNQHSHQ